MYFNQHDAFGPNGLMYWLPRIHNIVELDLKLWAWLVSGLDEGYTRHEGTHNVSRKIGRVNTICMVADCSSNRTFTPGMSKTSVKIPPVAMAILSRSGIWLRCVDIKLGLGTSGPLWLVRSSLKIQIPVLAFEARKEGRGCCVGDRCFCFDDSTLRCNPVFRGLIVELPFERLI